MKKLGLLLILLLCGCAFDYAKPLKLSTLDEISFVRVTENVVQLDYEDKEWIQSLLDELQDIEPIRTPSTNDTPNVEDYIRIDIFLEDDSRMTPIYVFTNDDNLMVEQPYYGKYIANEELLSLLRP